MNGKWDSVSAIGREKLNEHEQRAFGGFLVESDYNPSDFDLIQVQVPVGIQRTAGKEKEVKSDLALEEVLSSAEHVKSIKGFLTEKEISDKWGALRVSITAKVDVISVLRDCVYVIEIKTKEQGIEGMHDVYEGFGQVIMNKDRFVEDYPSVAEERETRAVLLGEDSTIDPALVEKSFIKQDVGFFDPRRGGFLIRPW